MAHLLNHSCEPNCYSRLTDVYDDGAGRRVEHVILYAKRDIAAFEELTYDYRRGICLAFSSEPAPQQCIGTAPPHTHGHLCLCLQVFQREAPRMQLRRPWLPWVCQCASARHFEPIHQMGITI